MNGFIAKVASNNIKEKIIEGLNKSSTLLTNREGQYRHELNDALNCCHGYVGVIDEEYKDSSYWDRVSKEAEQYFDIFVNDNNLEQSATVVFYILLVLSEAYNFTSRDEERLEIHYRRKALKRILDDASLSSSKIDEERKIYIASGNRELSNIRWMNLFKSKADKIVRERLEEVSGEIAELSDQAEELKIKVGEEKSAHNFVNLSRGFINLKDGLQEVVSRHSRNELVLKWVVGVSLVVIAIWKSIEGVSWQNSISYLGPAAFVAVLLYFLRLEIKERYEAKSKVSQIENKVAIIEFIQNYVGFSQQHGGDAANVMSKFDDLIFSPIGNSSDSDTVPNLTDNAEQVVNIIRSGKNAGKNN